MTTSSDQAGHLEGQHDEIKYLNKYGPKSKVKLKKSTCHILNIASEASYLGLNLRAKTQLLERIGAIFGAKIHILCRFQVKVLYLHTIPKVHILSKVFSCFTSCQIGFTPF